MKTVVLLFLLAFISPLYAIDLFGLELTAATRDQFRNVLKKSGVKVINQSGSEGLYDTYQADTLLQNAKLLYLGFGKQSNKFTFAEYEFLGLEQPALLPKMQAKYGLPARIKGKYMSDFSYQWQHGEVFIVLYQDWAAYKTRLTYFIQDALEVLRQEGKAYQEGTQQQSRFQEQAY